MNAPANEPETIAPPSKLLLALEARVAAWPVALLASAPFLMSAPRGQRQPVLVLPGLGATDNSTAALRFYLNRLGYEPHGWGLGRNARPAGADIPAVVRQIRRLSAASQTPVTLIGWSRGGLIAREAARLAHADVRMVITLGSPVAGVSATNVAGAWRRLTGGAPSQSPAELKALAAPLPVPVTSIFSRGDGVVAWRACLVAEGPESENVEVRGSHLGLGFNPAALWVVADRLAQAPGTWTPFRPSGLAAPFFPRRTDAATTGRRG
jgi:pimeloyl-ACP methyl ester carboxylesterase